MANTPEGLVKDKIKKWLKARSIPYWMIIPSHLGNSTGVSDFICILPKGRWLAIEAKSAAKKDNVTHHQKTFIDTINANGGLAVVVSCQEDLDILEKLIEV